MANCRNCGSALPAGATRCGKCGTAVPVAQASAGAPTAAAPGMIGPKACSPVLALILGIIFGGLGQLYIGQTLKGVVILVVSLLLWIFDMVFGLLTCGIGALIFTPIVILYEVLFAIDAMLVAKRLASGQAVSAWKFF